METAPAFPGEAVMPIPLPVDGLTAGRSHGKSLYFRHILPKCGLSVKLQTAP
jgi:hypothetical protein